MTIITEIYWECDWKPCGTITPILARNELGKIWKEPIAPKTWVTQKVPDFPENVGGYSFMEYTFCCEAHKQAWRAENVDEVEV